MTIPITLSDTGTTHKTEQIPEDPNDIVEDKNSEPPVIKKMVDRLNKIEKKNYYSYREVILYMREGYLNGVKDSSKKLSDKYSNKIYRPFIDKAKRIIEELLK